MEYNWNNLDKDMMDIRDYIKEVRQEINAIWDEVLFDGDEIINCCAIPKEMYYEILEQITDKIADNLYVLEATILRTPNAGFLRDYFGGKIYEFYRKNHSMQTVVNLKPMGE